MIPRKFYFGDDFIRQVERELDIFFPGLYETSFTCKGRLVDTDKYDIVPKQDYIDKEVKRLDVAIKDEETAFEQRKKELAQQREKLLTLKKK